jgi:hypothetical protein
MPVKTTPQYMELVRRMHDNHPERYTAEHAAFLRGTNLAGAAQQKIVELGAPELAHDDDIRRISSLPEAQHVAEIVKLHESKQSDGDHENNETDSYLADRAKKKAAR